MNRSNNHDVKFFLKKYRMLYLLFKDPNLITGPSKLRTLKEQQ